MQNSINLYTSPNSALPYIDCQGFSHYSFYHLYINICIVIIIIISTAIELSLGGSSPYTSTDKTNKNKCT
jgi:hypothetical protein